MKRLHIFLTALAAILAACGSAAQHLTTEQWKQDLEQLATAVSEIHFKPFHNFPEQDFNSAIDSLNTRLPELNDQEIILEMAMIVAKMKDGHSRLHIPRLYPELALEAELGHGGTPRAKISELNFSQSPLQFQLFDDGVFVVAASGEHRQLIGQKVMRFGNTDIEVALEAVKAVSFYENESRAKLMAPDRLALPQVLSFLDIIDDPSAFSITTASANGRNTTTILNSITTEGENFYHDIPTELPLWLRNQEEHKWFEILEEQDAIYVQVNEFEENPPVPYADFVGETLVRAREAGVSRYSIDLRHNSGGIGAWVTAFVTGLSSSEFNEYGRLYILMGRTTFSAAQLFLHRFEELTYATFVGEPSGAKPSHFGDSRRVQLENSGLTLRLSTIYWHSWLANDFRDAIRPHLSVAYNANHYFEGTDPTLEAVIAHEPLEGLALQMEEQFHQEKNQNALLLYNRYMSDGRFHDHRTIVPDLLEMADRLVRDGYTRPAYFVYVLVNQSYPGDADIEAELARLEAIANAAE
ncbi:MAG: hypothetical protein NPIRA05_01330 [Nitrospirales bacterium]|nr:MAG: hypothetical protein NPIRA05_01330 [Nitrospirales bacterium]